MPLYLPCHALCLCSIVESILHSDHSLIQFIGSCLLYVHSSCLVRWHSFCIVHITAQVTVEL